MEIVGKGKQTYLYLNGVTVPRKLVLANDIELLPASSPPELGGVLEASQNNVEFGVKAIFLPAVSSQIRIVAENPEKLAAKAWNSLWDAILIGALHDCEAACNFQCDVSMEDLRSGADLKVTNFHFRGVKMAPRALTESEASWLEANFEVATELMEEEVFQSAVHALATYRWHPHPRAQLALLWSGIEGLFKIDSELVFRLSLIAANFLSGNSMEEKEKTFGHVKGLYKQRSAAVHGGRIKGDAKKAVADSKALLNRVIRRCIDLKSLPAADTLMFT